MAHPIPKELKGEERFFTIPYLNLHFNKKGVIYNGAVTTIAAIIGKLTNIWVFTALFLITNAIAYPLAHSRIPKRRFEGGNVNYDKYFFRSLAYKKINKKIYVRKKGA